MPPVMPHQHHTAIKTPNDSTFVAPTDQWIALILDVLHPEQRDAVYARIAQRAQAQQDKPLVEIPGFTPPEEVLNASQI